MSSTALTDPRDDGASRGPLPEERAPSLMRDDDLFLPRLIGAVAAAAVIFGATAILLNRSGRGSAVGPGWASIILTLGIIGLLFHAAFDRDIQFRRVYMAFGYLAIGLGAFLCVLPYPTKAGDQFGPGFLCMSLGLLFLLCFLRHEADANMRNFALYVLAGAGGLMALFGLFGGLLNPNLLIGNKDTPVGATPIGLLLSLLGLVFLIASITIRGTSDEATYRIGQVLGIVGAFIFLLALLASFFPSAMWFTKKNPNYFMPYGLLLQILGFFYMLSSMFICSDRPFVVLTRRELGSFFYSPIAHLVLFSFVLAHWLGYALFMVELIRRGPTPEPIVSGFILQWASIFWTMFAVPALTMRLLAEENRANTLEQLLTVPVGEATVVLSKFFAAFMMFVITWLPFAFLMVSLRMEGGKEFDYRPLFSFGVGLFLTGAMFVSIGLFFSSLTSNQIISGVLTFGVMLTLTLLFLAQGILSQDQLLGRDSIWIAVMKHMSYIEVWIDTLDGKLVPKSLLFPASVTILCLFLTVKKLESRKWF